MNTEIKRKITIKIKNLTSAVLLLLFLLILIPSASAVGTNQVITAVLTITNTPVASNGLYIVFQGVTYRWTNLASPTIGYISTTNSAAASATNLYNRLALDYTNTLRFSYAGANQISVSTYLNGGLTISNNAGWLTNLFTTNVLTGAGTPASLNVPQLDFSTNIFSLAAITNGRPAVGSAIRMSNNVSLFSFYWSNGVVTSTKIGGP